MGEISEGKRTFWFSIRVIIIVLAVLFAVVFIAGVFSDDDEEDTADTVSSESIDDERFDHANEIIDLCREKFKNLDFIPLETYNLTVLGINKGDIPENKTTATGIAFFDAPGTDLMGNISVFMLSVLNDLSKELGLKRHTIKVKIAYELDSNDEPKRMIFIADYFSDEFKKKCITVESNQSFAMWFIYRGTYYVDKNKNFYLRLDKRLDDWGHPRKLGDEIE